MLAIYKRELSGFFSSLIAYLSISVFLIVLSLFLWVFTESSVLEFGFASLDVMFDTVPVLFMFLIPAITMKSFAEERSSGTLEIIFTKPLNDLEIILGKFFANATLVICALIPTLIYYASIYILGSPVGNIDSGGVMGSYFGLVMLGLAFTSIGILSSTLTTNQITAFILGVFLCFFLYLGLDSVSRLSVFFGSLDHLIQQLGMLSHYKSMSRGVIDTRDLIYFLSVIIFFIYLSKVVIQRLK
ncbi:MAG: gliding motility-associated ABC transporter permease subunit GldF [Chitinophagales bacterium]|nr:gliding motility-associated ABC transporter permease subunit GldF [Chitinophagales bacterium]